MSQAKADEIDIQIGVDEDDGKQMQFDLVPRKEEKAEKPAGKSDKKENASDVSDAKSADDPVALMKKRYAEAKAREDAERARRIEAETLAASRQTELQKVIEEKRDSEAEAITSAKAAAKAAADRAQDEYEAALEDGEYKKAGEAQRAMARAEALLLKLDEQEAAAKTKAAAPKAEAKPDTKSDPFEKYIGQFSPKLQQWFREHPDAATDEEKNLLALAADKAAKKKGFVPESEEYFSFVNKRLGYDVDVSVSDEDDDEDADGAHAAPARKTMPAAPVSRDNSSMRSSVSGNRVTLTPAEIRFTEAAGISKEDYARSKLALAKAGQQS